MERNNLFEPRQSGFRATRSTQYALLRIVHDVRLNIDTRLLTILILFDFSKAFDTIPHLNLLIKLKRLGFAGSAIDWLFSYLTGRTQAVVDDLGNCSPWPSTSSGVPEGSVLGTLLFTLYINNLRSVLTHSQHMIFADDTQIYLSCSPSHLRHLIELITEDVSALSNFASTNGLQFNLGKSSVLILGSDPYIRSIDLSSLPLISVNGVFIPYVNEARNRGVIFTANLSWKPYVLHISQKVHFALHKLKFHRSILSQNLRATLVSALIFPLIDYCCLVYHGLSIELDLRLQRLFNCGIRFIFDLRRDVHLTSFRRQLGWLSVTGRRNYFLGIAMFNVINRYAPSYILEMFPRSSLNFERSRRRPLPIFDIPLYRTESYQTLRAPHPR